jgi:chloride channel protein, CIC family
VFFQKVTLGVRAQQRRWNKVPGWLKPAIGAALAWVIGTAVFFLTGHLGVFSLGYGDLSKGLDNQLSWSGHLGWELAGILLVAKILATILSYGFGGCGGIFSPTLFFGGMSGLLVAGLFGMVMPMPGDDSITLAVVGMSACLGSVVRAPVTGILIVFEMTHEFSLVPVLMIGTLVSQAIGRRLSHANIYDAILEQDGHKLEKLLPPRDLQSWQKLPVSAIANFHPVVLNGTQPAEIEKALKEYPFARFPVMQDGTAAGIATRTELAEALAEKRPLKLSPAIRCEPRQTIRELQTLLLESPTGMVVVCDGSKLLGSVTLHDLLRGQMNAAQNSI